MIPPPETAHGLDALQNAFARQALLAMPAAVFLDALDRAAAAADSDAPESQGQDHPGVRVLTDWWNANAEPDLRHAGSAEIWCAYDETPEGAVYRNAWAECPNIVAAGASKRVEPERALAAVAGGRIVLRFLVRREAYAITEDATADECVDIHSVAGLAALSCLPLGHDEATITAYALESFPDNFPALMPTLRACD